MAVASNLNAVLLAIALPGIAVAADEPRAVTMARATAIPACTVFVDSATGGGDGTAQKPYKTIAAAIEAADSGAIICIAEGTYAEQLKPGEKYFTFAGGFQRGKDFRARDSAAYVTKAQGKGGSFIRYEDPAPKDGQLVAIDGFEITGYSQAIVRDFYESQRFDITNNFIHDNACADQALAGGGFALVNVSGVIKGNVIRKNSCGRGGAGFLNDPKNENKVSIENNLVDGNAGTELGAAHGGGLYFFGNTLSITNNEIINNSVTQWGGGLYIGAFTDGNQPTTATLSGNIYRNNRAGNSGGGFFCDDGATCIASNEIYEGNCGGNILVDGGSGGSGPTVTKFDHITNVRALAPGCNGPGTGLLIDNYEVLAPDSHTIANSIFWGNAEGGDFASGCISGCNKLKMSVTNSMAQTTYSDGSVKITFGPGIVPPADPLFAAPAGGDFSLKAASPARGKGSGGSDLGAVSGANVGAASPLPAALSEPSGASTLATTTPPVCVVAADAPAIKPTPSADDVQPKEAFEAAKELGTVKAWNAFLESFPTGFYANLARAYLAKLEDGSAAAPSAGPAPAASAPPASPAVATPEAAALLATTAPAPAINTAVARAGNHMGFPERFNRYYTDPSWRPAKTLYVSPDGSGNGATRETPMAAPDALTAARPGTMIRFLPGAYKGGLELGQEKSGTYDAPIVLYAERKPGTPFAVTMDCTNGSRQTCINFEAADYIAVDGFELIGGKYGVRAVGRGYLASEHSVGIAVLNCKGHDQDRDPFFSGQADWAVWEGLVAYGAKKGDGHGIYLSNGGDWNIVRFNETFSNENSDFQINADPNATCKAEGIAFNDPRCDAYAGEGEGGQGASDYFLVDGNYFHHGLAQGPNFTSVRRSTVRNNVFGPQTRHNVSFWQETDNPKLGSSDNKILHNLFISTGRHGVQFVVNSTRNEFANNVLVGIKVEDGKATANPSALLMEVDDTVGENIYRSNLYVSGKMDGRKPGGDETVVTEFSQNWFTKFPTALNHDANDFTPMANAPMLGKGTLSPDAIADRNSNARTGQVDLGPIEVP